VTSNSTTSLLAGTQIGTRHESGLMKLLGNVGVVLVVIACLSALVLSIYPGVLNELVFMGIMLSIGLFPIIGLLGTVGAIVLACLWRVGRLGRLRELRIHAVVAVAMLVCTYGLLKFYVPRRVAFAFSRSSFQQYLDNSAQKANAVPLNERVGLYVVDEYAADARGGTYFRVYSGADGIGPDLMSYGFCYRPNATGTPFGAAHYRTFRLGNGWYWFRASDDWY
jgi:hypothetical protein